jgi:hypothetical protein
LLERYKVAGLSVMHPPKECSDILAYYAGGSVAFGAVPRVVLGANADPTDTTATTPRRILAKIKGNLYGDVPMLAYQITADTDDGIPWLEWAAEPVPEIKGCTGRAALEQLFRPPRRDKGSKVEDCRAWLESYLAGGTERDASEGEHAAHAAGFTTWTLDQARKGLVDSTHHGYGKGSRWTWRLKGAPPAPRGTR